MFHTLLRRSSGAHWLALMTVLWIGCEPSPRPSDTITNSSRPSNTPTESPATVAAPSQPASNGEAPASTVAALEPTESAPSPAPALETPTPSTPAAEIREQAAATPAAGPTLKKPDAQPSAEQLAAWKWPEHDPVELLAAKESNKVGLVTCSARTLDGRFYVLAGFKVTLWSVAGTEPEHVFWQLPETSQDLFVRSLAVSSDGKWLAAGDSEGTVRIWNFENRAELISKQLESNDIVDLAFSPDSQSIATISFNSEVSVWSVDKLEAKSKWKVNTNGVRRIAFSTSETLIALGETASVWKVADGSLVKELPSDRYNMTLAYTNDRQSLVLGHEKELRLWNATMAEPTAFLYGGFADRELVTYAPDGKSLATANGNTIRLWDLASMKCVQVIDVTGTSVVGLEWLPGSNLIVAIPDFGPVRIWGTLAAGGAAGLKPIHKPIPTPNTSDRVAAYPNQMIQAIDFRTFPQPPNSVPLTVSVSSLNSESSIKAEDAKLFYRYQLGQHGWLESTEPSANPMAVEFRKDGFMISTSFYDSGDSKTYINLSHAGNFDLRWLPRLGTIATQDVYSSEHTVMYRTKADLLAIEIALLREMHKAGWTAYSRLHASHNEEPDNRNLTFINNYVDLHVSIQKSPDAPDQFMISYSRFETMNSLPIPSDSGYVEFDGATAPYLVATTSMSLDEAQAFYDREMEQQGWLPMTLGRTLKDEYRLLPYLQNQKEVIIGLQKQENGRTLVRVGKDLERDSWQLAKAKPADEQKEEKGEVGLQAADFPIPGSAKEVKYELFGKTIDFQIDGVTLAALAEQYTKAMAKLGWTAEQGGIRSEDYTFFNFEKDKQEIAFRATASQGNATVNIQGDGLLWTKELPGGKRIISYELWLRDHKHPATLELLVRYETEMKAIAKP